MTSGFLNFNLYFLTCIAFWFASIFVYKQVTPYPEIKLVREGNVAAALSLSGAAIGLALPLVSLALHATSLLDLAMWAFVGLLYQLVLWLVVSRTLLRNLHVAIPQGNVAMGLTMGAFSVGLGLLNFGCLSY